MLRNAKTKFFIRKVLRNFDKRSPETFQYHATPYKILTVQIFKTFLLGKKGHGPPYDFNISVLERKW